MQGNASDLRDRPWVKPREDADGGHVGRELRDLDHLEPVTAAQRLLFAPTPAQVCGELGLSLAQFAELQSAGFLSFGLDTTSLDEAQEAELRFVGGLAAAGCDIILLRRMLEGLKRPYSYDLKHVFYDWSFGLWRPLPESAAPAEAVFSEWLDTLVRAKDSGMLAGILELANEALAQVRPARIEEKQGSDN